MLPSYNQRSLLYVCVCADHYYRRRSVAYWSANVAKSRASAALRPKTHFIRLLEARIWYAKML